jgi:uncharacterized membrane protein
MAKVLSNLLEPRANASEITMLLISLLGVKVSDSTIKKEIEEHPDYPSLFCISDVLASFGIENIAIKPDPDKFLDIPTPFVTRIRGEKNSSKLFTTVKEINGNKINFFDQEKLRWRLLSKEDFLKRWLGTVVIADVLEGAGEKDYDKKIHEEKRIRTAQDLTAFSIPAIVIISGIITLLQNGTTALLPFIFSLLTLTGSITGVFLLWYELDQHNPLLQQICSTGSKVNCAAVLQSKASKIAGTSWSAIGFSYFTAMLLLFLFSGISNPRTLFIVAWINLAAVPYVLFSIYYQWRVTKQWCILCLCVQCVLVLQMITAFIGSWYSLLPFSSIDSQLIIQIIAAPAIPFIMISILFPALQKAKESGGIRKDLQRLKHNPELFWTLLQKQTPITENPSGLGITLGKRNAKYKLIKVCNPYCGPCAKAHEPMEDLLRNNTDLQIQILFAVTNSKGDSRTPVVKHLLAIAENNNEAAIRRALDDWYLPDHKDYEAFAVKYPVNGELDKQSTKIDAMQNWSAKVKIDFTPTFFVFLPDEEGEHASKFYRLPEVYNVSDLKYFFMNG